jgi:hypothetical protein
MVDPAEATAVDDYGTVVVRRRVTCQATEFRIADRESRAALEQPFRLSERPGFDMGEDSMTMGIAAARELVQGG